MSKPVCTDPKKDKAYRGSDGAVTCCLCDYEMEWEDCNECAGDGFVDCFEDDPNFYEPGETADCHQCGGKGGDWWCSKRDCPTHIALQILPANPA